MKIKEVEQRTGIGRANIHYYEKEGLLSPARNHENNYREYTEDDVKRLQKIKVLRMMGVSPLDVKLLVKNEIALEEVVRKRLVELEQEMKEAKNLQRVCENILVYNVDMETLDEKILTENQAEWKERLKEILEKDLVKETITRKQLNLHLMMSLVYGYFLNAVVAFIFGDFFLTYTRLRDPSTMKLQRPIQGFKTDFLLAVNLPVIVMMVAVILCSVAICCEASTKAHIIIFHICALITTPLVIELSRTYSDLKGAKEAGYKVLTQFSGREIAGFWILIIVYILALYLMSVVWDGIFTKRRYVFPIAGVFTSTYTFIAYTITGTYLIPLIMFGFMTLFIGISWTRAVRNKEFYNRYYAVIEAAKIMNVIGTLHSKRGGASASWH